MPNTFDSGLASEILSQTGITVLQNALPALRAFTMDFSDSLVFPKSTINVPVYTVGSTTLVDPTNFQAGDTTATNAQVVMSHYSQPFHITSTELNQGHRLENLAKINMHKLANAILQSTFLTLSTANYSASTQVASAGSVFTVDKLKAMWGEIKGTEKNIVLRDDYYANFLPSNLESFDPTKGLSVYGFDGFYHASSFAGADGTVRGFVCAPEAMAVAAAIPIKHEKVQELVDSTIVTVPDIGISFELNQWVDTGTRAVWASFDIAYGSTVGDSSALKLLRTA
jgi:hypothetical protein